MNRENDALSELAALRLRIAELEAGRAGADPEAYLHAIFDDMFEGIQIIDFDFKYVYLNETAAGQGRRSREELIGRRMPDRYPGIEQTEMFRLLQTCMKDRVPQRMVNHFTYPDGRSAWFDLRITPVPMGILVLSVDISEQKAVEEELRRSREDMATTLECMAEGVIATDVVGHVTCMNPAAQALTGWSKEEGMGRALDDLVGFLDQKTHTKVPHVVDKVLREGLKIGLANDTLLVTRDGAHIPIASSGAPIRDADGAIRGVVLVLKDMREEYELTAMLQRSQKMEALGRLAGGVAHDFNNLLTVISGYSDILLETLPPADPARESVDQIRSAGDRAATLTRQLLAFSRRQVLDLRVVDLNAVVSDTEKMLVRVLGEDIALTTTLEPHLGRVKADSGQLAQVIMNLAVNSRDAMPQGGKLAITTVNTDLDEAYVQAHPDAQVGRYVMLTLSDTGCGMEAATQARIFEPFFTTKEPGKGTGLGLAIVFGIVKQSGGHVRVDSEPGKGTMFRIYLPLIEEEAASLKPPVNHRAPSGHETILLVEDDEAVRAVTVSGLQKFGYSVLSAHDGREAIRICETHRGPIHLLLSDVVMPEIGGEQVINAVLALRPDIKVLTMSGYTGDETGGHGVPQGRVSFLQKPFTPKALVTKVREVLAL